MADPDTMNVLREVEYAEKSFKPMSNSKMWMRSMAAIWNFLLKYGIWLFLVAIAGSALYADLVGG